MAGNKNNKNDKNTENGKIKKTIFSSISGYDKEAKEGKGVKKRKITDKEKYSLKSFFRVYKQQFWNLIILNLIFMLMISPVICGILANPYMAVFHDRMPTPSNILFAPVYGVHLCYPTPATANLIGIYGAQEVVTIGNTVTVILTLIALLVFFTFGLANAGMTYILREYTRGEIVFLWHDFFKTIKKNFFGAMAMGIADLIVSALLVWSTYYYYTVSPDFSYTILFFITFAMCVVYFIMRFYLYILLITFKLSPFKLVKNALILALLGIKRNAVAIIGIGVFILLNVFIFMFNMPLGLTLPFFFLIAHCGFMACFAAYPNVKKYMIDPYYEEHPEKGEKFKIEEEPIFIDRG